METSVKQVKDFSSYRGSVKVHGEAGAISLVDLELHLVKVRQVKLRVGCIEHLHELIPGKKGRAVSASPLKSGRHIREVRREPNLGHFFEEEVRDVWRQLETLGLAKDLAIKHHVQLKDA